MALIHSLSEQKYFLSGSCTISLTHTGTSTSSTICTLMLPWLRSAHNSIASFAFSSGNTCETSGFTSRTPPLRAEMPAGHVSR